MLIGFAGIDGSGKDTQIDRLQGVLTRRDIHCFVSKAYGANEKQLFAPFLESCAAEARLFMFQAFHVEQFRRAIHALGEGKVVLANRWDEAYLAYHSQHGVLATDPHLRRRLNEVAFAGLTPNVTFLLDVDVLTGQKRIRRRGKLSFFDAAPPDYHERMRREYLSLARRGGWVILDGRKPKKEIHQDILSCLSRKFSSVFSFPAAS